jgi:hypothetical protein
MSRPSVLGTLYFDSRTTIKSKKTLTEHIPESISVGQSGRFLFNKQLGGGFVGTTYLYVHESEELRRIVVKTGKIQDEMNTIERHLNELDRACPIVRGIALARTSTLDDMIVMEAWSGDFESLLKEYTVTPPTLAFAIVRAIGSAL